MADLLGSSSKHVQMRSGDKNHGRIHRAPSVKVSCVTVPHVRPYESDTNRKWWGRCEMAIPSGRAEAPLDREEPCIKSHMGRFSHPLRSSLHRLSSRGASAVHSVSFLFLFLFPRRKIISQGVAPEQVSLNDADYGLRDGEPEATIPAPTI